MLFVLYLTFSLGTVVFWIADWFAQLNNKMGGDLKKIQTVGKYMIEIWKATGMPIDGGKVEFLWASEEINKRSELYWTLVMDICSTFNISRLKRCICSAQSPSSLRYALAMKFSVILSNFI